MTIRTDTEKMMAMTIPMTTRGMALTCKLSRNAIIIPVHTSRMIARNVEKTSPPLFLNGFKVTCAATRPNSTTSKSAIWTSARYLAKAIKRALRMVAARKTRKK